MPKQQKNKKYMVFEYLRKRIIDSSIPPGFPISEGDLAEELGVSKTPIREALRQLEKDGLVQNTPGRGSNVTNISSRDISEVFQLREIIECGAAKRAALLPDKDKIIEKRKEVQQLTLNKQRMSENVYEWGAGDDIHLCIVNSLGNHKLTDVYQGLLDQIRRIRIHIGKKFTQRRFDEITDEHLAILDSIIEGNSDSAEQMMYKHLNNAVIYISGIVTGY